MKELLYFLNDDLIFLPKGILIFAELAPVKYKLKNCGGFH